MTEKTESTAVVEYGITNAALADLRQKYDGMTLDNPGDLTRVKAGIVEVRTLRTGVEKHRIALKADALAWGRKVDKEAKRITAALVEIEEPLKELKQLEDARVEAIAEEKRQAVQKRIDDIRGRIDDSFGDHLLYPEGDLTVEDLQELIRAIDETPADASYEEFEREAQEVKRKTLIEARIVLDRKMQQNKLDQVRAELEAEQARQEELRLEQEAEQKAVWEKQQEAQRQLDMQEVAAREAHAKQEAEVREAHAKQEAKEEAAAQELIERKAEMDLKEAEQEKIRLDNLEAKRQIDEEREQIRLEQKRQEERRASAAKFPIKAWASIDGARVSFDRKDEDDRELLEVKPKSQ